MRLKSPLFPSVGTLHTVCRRIAQAGRGQSALLSFKRGQRRAVKPGALALLLAVVCYLYGAALFNPLTSGQSMALPAARAALPVAVDGQNLPSLADMLEKVTPAVVNIATSTRIQVPEHPLLSDPFFRRFFDIPTRKRSREHKSLGSGVVVDAKNGYVMTNHHVIDKADKITVTLRDGRTIKAKLVGVDPDTDVAVIQVAPRGLKALPLADSDKLRVGDFVVAIGNPFGLGQTVTSGIVSALGRSGLGIEGYEDFIQTDASINPGNSGGALVNLRGELVGINTAILARGGGNVGIGFAIPVNMAQQIMAQLVSHGEVRRGQLGVQAQDLTPELANAFGLSQSDGAVVTRVTPGGAAERAGIRSGDVIVGINGTPVRDAAHMRNQVGLLRVGRKATIALIRDGRRLTRTALVSLPKAQEIAGEKIDARLEGSLLVRFPNEDENGALLGVKGIKRRSQAARIGLRPGDVILGVNRRRVQSFADLKKAMSRTKRRLEIEIQRGDRRFLITLR